MVRGLEPFKEHFSGWEEHYVLIGGTSTYLAFQEQGIPFRATKDLDLLLHLEVLDQAFMSHFWEFIRKAGYQIRGTESRPKPRFYRFEKPIDQAYPHMIELLCRKPETVEIPDGLQITPIESGRSVSALSAIILDSDYYNFVIEGKRIDTGLSWIGADRLIPLKAVAWLNLNESQQAGGTVKPYDLQKHHQDVFKLADLLDPANPIPIPERIKEDLRRFLNQFPNSDAARISRMRSVYGL